MESLEIMTKIYEKIKASGWKSLSSMDEQTEIKWVLSKGLLKSFVFNHDVAEKFWGEEELSESEFKQELYGDTMAHCFSDDYHGQRWQYHLQQMVLEKEPLKYMEKFL